MSWGFWRNSSRMPHSQIRTANLEFGDRHFTIGDFTRLPTICKFIALMPQWDFLDFLAGEAKAFPNFHLLMQTRADDLIIENNVVTGVTATAPQGPLTIKAGLTVAADGRHSTLRDRSGLAVEDLGAPFDVLWLRLPVLPGDPVDLIGRVDGGQLFVMIYRKDYWQCAYLIPKGGFDAIKADGLEKFRDRLKLVSGFAAARIDHCITDFDQIKLLTVAVDRLKQWARPGLLCIGDAAHAMSPIGGVGINLAIQDAVATANICRARIAARHAKLRRSQYRAGAAAISHQGDPSLPGSGAESLLAPTLRATATPKPPFFVKLFDAVPWLRQLPARFIGMGVRPEHVKLKKM